MIVLQNISKYYYTDASVTQALRKVNLAFCKGEFVAITGESGSGKSTLLNVISGMDSFDDGEMYYKGEPTFQFDDMEWEDFRRNRIGFVFQNYNLIGQYSALENIVSVLLIMEMDEKEAKKRALYYLEKVGLKGMENQRAAELSSGQKQRLSIARALAKNTEIIVADEPTGNLDSETGEQIIRLLKEISRDRLVLMVTHNYEQAEPYVTRKVRLHDGEVVVDERLNKEENECLDRSMAAERKNAEVFTGKKQGNHIVRSFARMNTRTQRGRAFRFRFFLLITAVVSFIFIGQLYKNADDVNTKDYDDSIFYQKNDSRLSVSRKDGKALTEKDIKKMQSVRNVLEVDSCDYANDVNYYEEGEDFHFGYGLYGSGEGSYVDENGTTSSLHSDKIPVFDSRSKFVRSVSCINNKDLKSGRLPESYNEIVIYSEREKDLETLEKEIYFTNENFMGSENYYHNSFKVVGLLKKKTSQIYFHRDLCRILTAVADGDQINLEYFYIKEAGGYIGKNRFYLAINEELEKNEVLVSCNYVVPAMEEPSGDVSFYNMPVEDAVPGTDALSIIVNKDRMGTQKELIQLDSVKKEGEIDWEQYDGQSNSYIDESKGILNQYYLKEKVLVSGERFNDQGGAFLEVSQEFFDKYCPRKSTQASVYIKDYTKTDSVIRNLDKLGYIAISTYRVSSVKYNAEKVMSRLIFILISLGILFVMILVEILILRSLMKIKIKDFFVLKSMGMRLEHIRKISLYEMTEYCIEMMVVTVIVMAGLSKAGIELISSTMTYYGILAFVTFVLYNLLLECVTVWAFNWLLRGRMES